MAPSRFEICISREAWQRALTSGSGVSSAAELANRAWACTIICESSILLRLPEATTATAQLLLHRYFCRVQMRSRPQLIMVASAAVFLATKIEETRRKVRDILSVIDTVLALHDDLPTDATLNVSSSKYLSWRQEMLSTELKMLGELGFMLYCEQPHRFILNYVQMLSGGPELAQLAWNFLNDSLRQPLCVEYRAESLAAASIMLAARLLRICLPSDPGSEWYTLFNSSRAHLLRLCSEMTRVYTESVPFRYRPLDAADMEREDERELNLLEAKERAAISAGTNEEPMRTGPVAPHQTQVGVGGDQYGLKARDTSPAAAPSRGDSSRSPRRKDHHLYRSRSRSHTHPSRKRRSRSRPRRRSRGRGRRSRSRSDSARSRSFTPSSRSRRGRRRPRSRSRSRTTRRARRSHSRSPRRNRSSKYRKKRRKSYSRSRSRS